MTAASAGDSAAHELEIVATAGKATITASGDGRRVIRLPSISYSFQLLHDCGTVHEPRSLSLTVADSHLNFGAEAMAVRDGVVHASLEVPAAQIAPVAVNGFCAAGEGRGHAQALTIASIMSASASLRCADDVEQRVTYSAVPLDVVLVCEPPPEADRAAADRIDETD
jgi:hypothetical protein